MKPLQRKFLMVSALLHGLLLVLLIVGSAFAPKRPTQLNDLPVLHVIPAELLDLPVSGGGEPPPAVTEAQVEPEPVAPVVQRVEPPVVEREQSKPVEKPKEQPKPVEKPKPTVKPKPVEKPKPAEKPKEVVKPKPKEIKVSTALKTQKQDVAREARDRAAEAARRQQQEAARALESRLARASQRIQAGASSSTKIDIPGPGGGGAAFANWNQAVLSIYDRYWVPPSELKDDRATVVVEVEVNHDGKVLRDRVVSGSGIASLDNSVKAALDVVRRVGLPKFPAQARAAGELQRTVRINFNLSSKLRLG
jgi:TonB family protein